MRAILILLVIVVLVAIAAIWLGFVNIDQTRQAALPSVQVQGGQAPAFQVATPQVEVGTTNTTVETPTVSVQKPR